MSLANRLTERQLLDKATAREQARVSAWPLVRAGICAAFAGIVLAILVILAFCLQGRP